ncbi:MAG TPA: outer membrane protein OmpK, partial [bacterium]|nr:outer membrane protein OmpK [bacterium]
MKRWVLLGVFLLSPLGSGPAAGAEYQVGERHKNDNIWLQLNFYSMIDAANAFGPTYKLSYLELEGGGRSSFLDLYYFFDINEIFGWGDLHAEAGNFFTKVKPRFSLDCIFARDLSAGPVREWYLATQYKGFNGGEYYYAGVGVDLDVPGMDVLGLCFWPQFLRTGEGVNFEYTGLQFSLNWYTLLFELPWE